MILAEAGLEFRKRGIFLTVDEKLLKCSLFHYLRNEWKITDWTEIGDKLVVNRKVYFHFDVPKKWLPVNSSVNTHEDYGNGTAEQQEPLQSQEESSDFMVQSQEPLSQSK